MKINSKNRGFAQGTMIVMADGKTKPIEQIKTGDLVLSFDENDAYAPLEPRRVLDTFERIDNNVLEVKVGDTVLKVAQDQMFIGPYNDWKQVYNHSMVVDIDGNPVNYEVSQVRTGKHRIYDITVDENHSLIANGIRVHNVLGDSNNPKSAAGATQKSAQDSNKAKGPGGGNPKGPETKTQQKSGPNSPDRGGGGKTKDKSAGGGMQGNPNGGYGNGGQNNGVGGRGGNGQYGNGQNSEHKKFVEITKRFTKKNKEPEPKPNGSAVASKLLNTIEDNVNILSDIIISTTPTQLTTFIPTITATIQITNTFATSFISSIVAADMTAYDKSSLIEAASDVENTLTQLSSTLRGSTISAASQILAQALIVQTETYIHIARVTLSTYLTSDTSGGLTVYVNGTPTREPGKIPTGTYRKDSGGKYTNAKPKVTKVRGKKRA